MRSDDTKITSAYWKAVDRGDWRTAEAIIGPRELGAPPIPYGPYAVGEALALMSRVVGAARNRSRAWIGRLEPRGAR